jgi:hypothetical protein
VTIKFGDPIHVPNNIDRTKMEDIKDLLEKELLSLKGL